MTTVADRNNNPGNLILNKIVYQGQTGIDSRGFAVFDSKEAGIRAADLNLQTYAKRGYDTIHKIIYGTSGTNGWSATDQAAYQAYLSKNLRVDPNQPIDLNNPTVRQNVLANIFNFESGTTRYSDGALSDTWADIQKAAATGNPLDVIGSIAGAGGTLVNNVVTEVIGTNASNAIGSTVDAATGAVSKGLGFDLGGWLNTQLSGVAKDYLLPAMIGIGAIFLIFFSSWGLVKDGPVGQAVKTGAKTAVMV